jgi:hypothetical protein
MISIRAQSFLCTIYVLITAGCETATTPSVANHNPQATPPAATQPGLPQPEKYVSLVQLPDANDIGNLRLARALPGSRSGGELEPDDFKTLLATAQPIDADATANDGWAYSPWYTGQFDTPDGTYRFSLYLGGRGKLQTPSGDVGLFSYVPPDGP